MSDAPTLRRQLREFAAHIPGAVSDRLAAAASEITASGLAAGLAIGDHAPDFTLPNAVGTPVQLTERLTRGPVVLSFYRGEWCPFCNLELQALESALPRFAAYNASLIAISPQSPDHSLSVAEKHNLTFDVLSDIHQDVIRAYQVHYTLPADMKDLYQNLFHNDLSTHTADGSWDLPIPATFVINRSGIITARHVSADYMTRMDPDDIETALAARS
jgi:peroxiredoxin